MRIGIVFAALVALPLAPAAAATKPAAAKASVTRDWSRTVALTPDGGFRMGNPAARVKLVEYGSLACPHCRHFEQTGYKPLVANYVRTGKVSYEFRNLLINGPDISITLLARCSGPGKFFAMSQYVYSTQPQWEAKVAAMSDKDKAALEAMTDQQRIVRFADLGGFTAMAARYGVTPARARQCLTDQKGLKQLLDMVDAANGNGIRRTPTFIIDGNISEAANWEDLEPALKAALDKHG